MVGEHQLQLTRQEQSVTGFRFVGLLLALALVAFELFNFDTTQFALTDFLGDERFAGLRWATILAVAFCAIDFAGLARLFTPPDDRPPAKEVWYLMGAWLLGASLNAIMTWWAVSLTLLNHELGNEVLSRAQLLEVVPIFVALLVWLTRILFIGAMSSAGNHLFSQPAAQPRPSVRPQSRATTGQARRSPQPAHPSHSERPPRPAPRPQPFQQPAYAHTRTVRRPTAGQRMIYPAAAKRAG
ncbi:MAG: hypothetical protein R3300_17395 [Candidatus Promineifilaceae bacterium]|nr:hypothetical protein [Candidatus Promineifilaceae bacterium]